MFARAALARTDLGPRLRLVTFQPAAVAHGLHGLAADPAFLGHFHDVALAGVGEGHVVVLDISALPVLNGLVLGLFLRAHQAARQRLARLVLAAPPGVNRDVLHISRLDRVLEVVARPEDVPHPPDVPPVPSFLLPGPGGVAAGQSP